MQQLINMAKGKADRPANSDEVDPTPKTEQPFAEATKVCNLWIHDEGFSKEEVLFNADIFGESAVESEHVIEIGFLRASIEAQDFASKHDTTASTASMVDQVSQYNNGLDENASAAESLESDENAKFRFIATPMPQELRLQHPSLQICISKVIAETLGFCSGSRITVRKADPRECTATHVEIYFRDQYLARSDLWRLAISELAGKTVYRGQKLLFLGTIKAVVRNIYDHGQKFTSAYFAPSTIPIFRSESARYVIFVQMSKEMWDFDAEGRGEILFSRVIDGFLPGLFRRWAELEAKHLVSIVMFGRLECSLSPHHTSPQPDTSDVETAAIDSQALPYKDFYRVVVSDMSSGQWRSILDELKKEFRVFLRDISLQHTKTDTSTEDSTAQQDETSQPSIDGRPSSALRGNILEAINVASFQYAKDHLDRDLVRTGLSVVIISAGNGVFEADRDLLALTSEYLTNNGIGIDLVCLSRMPLHSVPLFIYRPTSRIWPAKHDTAPSFTVSTNVTPALESNGNRDIAMSASTTTLYGSTSASAYHVHPFLNPNDWQYGIPQWIDVSYWVPELDPKNDAPGLLNVPHQVPPANNPNQPKPFIPRARMYELQMMGIMELGLANISIPYLSEIELPYSRPRTESKSKRGLPTDDVLSPSSSLPKQTGLADKRGNPLGPGTQRKGLLTGHARQQKNTFDRMEEYDRVLFRPAAVHKARNSKRELRRGNPPADYIKETRSKRFTNVTRSRYGVTSQRSETAHSPFSRKSATASNSSLRPKSVFNPSQTSTKISRSISFALRGLGTAAPRAVASTEVNVQHAQAETPSKGSPTYRSLVPSTEDSTQFDSLREPSKLRHSRVVEPGDHSHATSQIVGPASRPISIKKPGHNLVDSDTYDTSETENSVSTTVTQIRDSRSRDGKNTGDGVQTEQVSQSSRSTDSQRSRNSTGTPCRVGDLPWITNLNPSNPKNVDASRVSWFGRWQHVFPKAPRASAVKWRSLCTPAAIPLTTLDLPSRKQLSSDYVRSHYSVTNHDDDQLLEVPRTRECLLREMISLRLSHGYQFVLNSDIEDIDGYRPSKLESIYSISSLSGEGATIFMVMGNTVQRLLCTGTADIQVTKYVKKSLAFDRLESRSFPYIPKIKTILSTNYFSRPMNIAGTIQEYPWNSADQFLAGHYDQPETLADRLRFWRARFVLIPVEPPPTTRRPGPAMSQDNEEEIRLLGIQQLTQMWQRCRYVPAEERRFAPKHSRKKMDDNPLEINFQTRNASEIIANEVERLRLAKEASRPTQLLPESDLFSTASLNVGSLAQTMQGDKGVEIKNRLWHLRTHQNSFIGEAMTTWLLQNFRDIETREEAVELGNELMAQGVFQHVDRRHNFRDGMFYYQFGPDYRQPRPESRNSWLPGRRSDKSMPPTPGGENTSKTSPLRSRPRSDSDLEKHEREASTLTPTKGNSSSRMSVSMSKLMRLDVDSRKRSNRPEIIDLHYDRLHNPENCYHFELAWINVTSKLVEDTVVSWTATAERYGLKCVEVPIGEASSINTCGPFRTPSIVKLEIQPPVESNNTPSSYFDTESNPRKIPSDKFRYHKAILKRFNFVLDREAAGEFPQDVDVIYSWGKLEYQCSQYVHRSGVLLAQITGAGEFLLLGNRLFDTRSAANREANKFDANYTHAAHDRRPPQGTAAHGAGIRPLTSFPPQASYQSPHLSPLVRATSDVLGPHALATSGLKTYITPEQIKTELEMFCSDAQQLDSFYQEVRVKEPSSSVLRSVQHDAQLIGESAIPDLQLNPSEKAGGDGSGRGTYDARNSRDMSRDRLDDQQDGGNASKVDI